MYHRFLSRGVGYLGWAYYTKRDRNSAFREVFLAESKSPVPNLPINLISLRGRVETMSLLSPVHGSEDEPGFQHAESIRWVSFQLLSVSQMQPTIPNKNLHLISNTIRPILLPQLIFSSRLFPLPNSLLH